MTRRALILIDMQIGAFDGDRITPIHSGDNLLRQVQRLLEQARTAQVPVLYVQHSGGDLL